ncbi:LysR family transcriptional regulator [Erwiniaceae bacterium BAC15a-03b]|uniref:LysR family transcriptional regulator n=1 Tax=Winslowiella arboricola TaxID=2978220 RepID=A0A9J6PVS9_9GAMM|nr:LysR family transcriptional regulator [Winslowiella arboricola]MCU5775534.1 LysR family transcriptional regulator [Winslowiella arboricola]MCU5779616.1 LysR family transcriptional regulator [Winslowiella arboricola]
MISSDRLKGITPFVISVETGSFTAAAEKLHLSNSAVSKSIARLEERLGSRLFDRTTRSLMLTDAGQAFYQTCSRVLDELAEAESVLAAQRNRPAGRLRIALPHSFGRLQVLPLLNRFCREYPDVQLNITFTDRFIDLIEDGIDIAVRIGGPADYPASLGYHYLGSEQLIFCAAPDYLHQHGAPLSADQLSAHRCVAYARHDGSTTPWTFTAADGRSMTREISHAMALGDGEALLTAVVDGMGVAQIASWLAREPLARGELTPLLEPLVVEGLPLYLLWPQKKQLTPKVDALLQALKQLKID